MHMKLEDFYQQWDNKEYTQGYLLECRQQLLRKVESYGNKIEELQTEKAELSLKHQSELFIKILHMELPEVAKL